MRINSITFLIFLLPCYCFGQESSEAIDELYEKFAKAYEELNVDDLIDLYAIDGEVMNLYDDRIPSTLKGQDEIRAYFYSFFAKCDSSNQKLFLSFKILDRREVNGQYLDNGFYKLEFVKPSGPPAISYGRFSIVVLQENNAWKYRTDANTSANSIEYEDAESDPIPFRRE